MAKYLDDNGLLYFWQKIKNRFSVIGHTHGVSVTTGDSVTVTAGTAAALTTNPVSIPQTSYGSKTVVTGGSTTGIPNVTNAGAAATASFSGCTLILTSGTAPTLGTKIAAYTSLTTGNSIETNALQPITFNAVDTFTANTPTSVTKKTVVTAVSGTTGGSAT